MARRKKSRAERVADAMSKKAKLWSDPVDTAGQAASACWLTAKKMVRSKLHETPEERRERFEKWVCKVHKKYVNNRSMLDKYGDGTYLSEDVEHMWDGFNAALDFTR